MRKSVKRLPQCTAKLVGELLQLSGLAAGGTLAKGRGHFEPQQEDVIPFFRVFRQNRG